jgi:DNA-binding transcriptional ArsR family regulator
MAVSSANSDVFFAIADPTRRRMLLRMAREGEKSVTELMAPFSISQPAVSKHLRCLREAGLVRCRTAGRLRFYEVEPRRLRQVREWVTEVEKFWDQRLDALGAYLDRKKGNKEAAREV